MARTLWVVTHPEATHHVEGLVGGWYDSALTPAGAEAASAIAAELRARIPSAAEVELYASDLRRTRETATPLSAAFDVPPTLDPRLREKSYGEAEGRPQPWLRSRFVPPPPSGDRLTHDEGIPGAETKAAWAHRVYAAMTDILHSSCPHQIIVTHGGTLTFVVTSWLRIPIESAAYASFPPKPGSITTLTEDDFFHNRAVTTLASTTHLA